MFELLKRLCKEESAMAFSGTFRFGCMLFNAAPDLYKYDWVWQKDNGTNAPNVNLQPFRVHENIYIFGKGRVTNGKRTPMKYNPQKTEGKPYCQKSGRVSENWKGGLRNVVTDNPTGLRHPKTIQFFCRDKHGLHPTQKPIALMEYLIKTYTNENDLVLDFTMGSGTTGVACQNLNRRFIGIEWNPELDKDNNLINPSKYFDIAVKRMQENLN
jgi:site-specific DNA-methyltransferase (adenine-specific)